MIHKGDNVIVISGAHKGKTGKVHQLLRERQLVVVEGVNLRKKHERARRANQKGQLIEKAMPISLSNVSLIDSASGKATRVGRKQVGEKWVRVSRKSGKEI
ncbi:MAG: 50S ribosomal protein L24 [bacterium]|nr:50S ribosomal protein L24 [bacterium]